MSTSFQDGGAAEMNEERPLDRYRTVDEAAGILGITRQAVVKAISSGHISAERKGKSYLISVEQIEMYKQNSLRDPHVRGRMGGRPKRG